MPKFTITIKGEARDTSNLSKLAAHFAHKIGAKQATVKWSNVTEVTRVPTKS